MQLFRSLNPCFNGRYSLRNEKLQQLLSKWLVLILVLMEDTLRVCVGLAVIVTSIVLILVLMEDTL